MMYAPITLFTFNRLMHTKSTLDALLKNRLAAESDLWIFSDGPSNDTNKGLVEEVRAFLHSVTGFKSIHIIERTNNLGLGSNIIAGVTQVVEQYGKIIVLEDDLITSPYFLEYMNDGLQIYADNEKVISVHGYVYPVDIHLKETFFLKGADCLGWGTWKSGWENFEKDGEKLLRSIEEKKLCHGFDYDGAYPYTQMLRDQIKGKNTSWAVRWYASAFLKDLYTLYPCESLILHAGGDGSGTNTGLDELLDVKLAGRKINVIERNVEQETLAYHAFAKVLRRLCHPPLFYRLKRKMKQLLN